jgi:hypothetical protein
MTEKQVHTAICKYLDAQYPDVIYTSDPSGMRVSIGLVIEMKAKRCKRYKIPDLLILHPSDKYAGLFMEIKKDLSQIVTKSGDLRKDKHTKEQNRTLEKLQQLGYAAIFAAGFDHAKKAIDLYFKNIRPSYKQ